MLRERKILLGCGLAALDAAMMSLAYFCLTVFSLGDNSARQFLVTATPTLLVATTFILTMYLLGAYQSQRRSSRVAEVRLIARAALMTALALPTFSSMLRHSTGQHVAAGWEFVGLSLLTVGSGRLVVRTILRTLRSRGHNLHYYLVAGTGPRARELAAEVLLHSSWGIEVIGHLIVPGDLPESAPATGVLGKLEDLDAILESRVADGIFLVADEIPAPLLRQALECCRRFGIQAFVDLHPFAELCGTLTVSQFAKSPLLVIAHTRLGVRHEMLKRAFDFLGAAVGLVLLSPLLLLITVSIKLGSSGPVLFRQLRVGVNGRTFTMLKFRSMVENAEHLHAAIACHNEMSGPVFKMRDDPRVSGVGRYLRMWSLDELPQLWNVLGGDMSLVGPRPPLPREVGQYESWQRRRLSVRPGLTCLWQVSGRNQIDFDAWMKLDLEYIDHWSWWLDLKILCRTLPAMLRGQ